MDESAGRERAPAAIEMDLVQAQVHERLFGEPAREVTIGRFEVVAQAGAGGMGVVFVANDPELGRRVAIKLVSSGTSGGRAQARLLGEAQTLARLSHPNIVAVHEVGAFEDRIFVAMEHIDGETLERWLDRSPRPSRAEILRAFVQAGQGLAAAHRAGVVHGDFKPSNAMIDRAGRVRVLDFGLAIAERSYDSIGDVSANPGRTVASRGGTPLYMSLEQWQSQPATPKSDQYAFCVSLWVALYGSHPFAGDGEDAMLAAMTTATVRPTRSRGVPGWLRDALLRGLQPAPAQRWPGMDALVDALEHGHARARRRRAVQALVVSVAALAVFLGARAIEHRRAVAACERVGDELAAPWDVTRSGVRAAIEGSGLGYAADTVEKLEPHLEAYAALLHGAGTEACLAGEVSHELDPELYARARACLADRHDALVVLLAELASGDPENVRTAVMGALGLPEVAACANVSRLASLPQPPADARDDVRAVRAELVRANVLRGAGRSSDATAVLDRIEATTHATGWAPLVAELAIERAWLLVSRGDERSAAPVARDAYLGAARVGAWDVAARAAALELSVVGIGLGRYEEALLWNQLGELAELHASQAGGLLAAGRLGELSAMKDASGDKQGAKRAAEESLEIEERELGPDNPRIARGLAILADAELSLGDYDRARELYERAHEITVQSFGADHPSGAHELTKLGMLALYTGDPTRARELCLRAVTQLQRTLPPDHPQLAGAEGNLAVVELELHELASARARIERTMPVLEATYGPEHAEVAAALTNLGISYYYAGSYEAARVLFERALEIEEVALGPRHPNVAKSLASIANLHHLQDRSDEALALLDRALAIDESVLGPDHPDTALLLRNIAGIYRDRGELARAIPLAERAIAIYAGHDGVQQAEPRVQFMLALMLVDSGGDRDRAIALTETALVGYRALRMQDKVESAEGWLAEQKAIAAAKPR